MLLHRIISLGIIAAWIIATLTRCRPTAVECIPDYAALLTGWIKLW